MKSYLPVLCVLAALVLLSGCGRSPARAGPPPSSPTNALASDQTGAPAPIEIAQPAEQAKPKASYRQERDRLLSQGFGIAAVKVRFPSPDFPELDCEPPQPGNGGYCWAAFIKRDKRGWQNYYVVNVEPGTLWVEDSHWARTADGLPSIPPPPSPDIPRLNSNYWQARPQLLALGFRPTSASDQPYKVCAAQMATPRTLTTSCKLDTTLPEIENCAGSGAGFCEAFWLEPGGKRVLEIVTIGEPQPGEIYYMSWATSPQLKQLPAHWRP